MSEARVGLVANVLDYPAGGGHFWAYLNWALGLRSLGCEVTWIEKFPAAASSEQSERWIASLSDFLDPFDLGGGIALFGEPAGTAPRIVEGNRPGPIEAEGDLILNLRYDTPPEVLGRFRRTALVDVDPGLLQIWWHEGQIRVEPHDLYLTISEAVGKGDRRFPDCGVEWHWVPRPVSLDHWTKETDDAGFFTTVTHWWDRWVKFGDEYFSNSKRDSFLRFLDLPSRTNTPLELAVNLPEEDPEYALLRDHGWSVRNAAEVSGSPDAYSRYVGESRGEFSCVKPSCVRLQNAWVSDRTVCYLASGRPAIVEDTGPIGHVPDGMGFLRFTTVDQAAQALNAVQEDYEAHARSARKIAEEVFDARKTASRILELAS